MSRKTINNVRIVQWGNTLSDWEEINSQGPEYILKKNELGIIDNNNGKAKYLVVGDGSSTVAALQENATDADGTNVFISGKGAGYTLPTATEETPGAIKIDSKYFTLVNEKLTPVLLTYVGSVADQFLTLPEDHDLRINGTLYVDNLVSSNRIEIKVDNKFINIHKKLDDEISLSDQIAATDVLFIDLPQKYHINSHVVIVNNNPDFNHYWYSYERELTESEIAAEQDSNYFGFNSLYLINSDGDDDTLFNRVCIVNIDPETEEETLWDRFVVGEDYQVQIYRVSDVPSILEDGATSGIRIFNYNKEDVDVDVEYQRRIAEISIDNTGALWFSQNVYDPSYTTVEDVTEYHRIGILKPEKDGPLVGIALINSSGYLVAREKLEVKDLPTHYTCTINDIIYDPFEGDTIMSLRQDYCDTIIANGQEYKVTNNIIDLGAPVWTEELYDSILSAVQTITFNGQTYYGPDASFNYEYNADISGGLLIHVEQNDESFTINHKSDVNYEEVAVVNPVSIGRAEGQVEYIDITNTIVRDQHQFGHLLSYANERVSFVPLLDSINQIKTDIENIKDLTGSEFENGVGIKVTKNSGVINIAHKEYEDYSLEDQGSILIGPQDRTNFNVISLLERDPDNLGHVLATSSLSVSFEPLLEYVEELAGQISSGMGEIISNKGLTIQQFNYKTTIDHKSYWEGATTNSELLIGLESTQAKEFTTYTSLKIDSDILGHVTNTTNQKINFTPLITEVSSLKTWISNVDSKISIGLTMPEAFTVEKTPINNKESFVVGLTEGYQIPTTTQIQTWNDKQDKITIDTSLLESSTNPVQNKVVYEALRNKQDSLADETILTINGTPLKLEDSITIETGTSVTEETVEGWGFTKNTGTVTSIKIGEDSYEEDEGVVTLPSYPAVPTKISQLENDSNFTSNTGTVTSVLVKAEGGLTSSTTAAGNEIYETTISIDDNHKLPTKEEWDAITGGTSVVDTNQKIKVGDTTFGDNAEVNLKAGSNITIETGDNTITISATNSGEDSEDSQAVLYVEQELTDDQKSQARTNIGAASDHDHTAYVEKNADITSGTHCKITYDSKGLVTKGDNLTATDVPELSSDKITSLTGYSKATETSDITESDSLNSAIGKLEKAIENASSGEANVQSNWAETDESSDAYILNKPSLAKVATSGSYKDLTDIPTVDGSNQTVKVGDITFDNNAIVDFVAGLNVQITGDATTSSITISATDTTYDNATSETDGLMSRSDKSKLDGIAEGANAYTHPDTHPVDMIDGLADIATSGLYDDLINKPTIPDVSNASNWDEAYSWGDHADAGYLKTQDLEGYVQSSELGTINGQSILDGDITINVTDTDKKTSSGNTSSRIYLVGATSRSAEGQTTYSNGGVYVDTNNKLYSESSPVVISGTNNSTIPYKIITITSANYQALVTKDPNTLYFIVG